MNKARRASGLLLALVLALVASIGGTPLPAAAEPPVLSVSMAALNPAVKSGDPATWQLSWACASVSEPCVNMQMVVKIPTAQPDGFAVLYDSATASSGGFSGPPVLDTATQTLTWTMSATIPGGSSGQMAFSLVPPNYSTPNGDTLTPVATLTADGAIAVTDEDTTTVEAAATLSVEKVLANPRVVPGLDQPVVFRVAAGQKGDLNGRAEPTFSCGTNGRANLQNIVVTDQLPAGAVFNSATDGGVFDAATNTVTWPARSETNFTASIGNNRCGGWPPSFFVTMTFPSTNFISTDVATNTAIATAELFSRPEQTLTATASVSTGFTDVLTGSGLVAKRGAFPGFEGWRGLSYSGQGGTQWLLNYANTGNTSLVWDAVDVLPCDWTSPTNADSTDCATPAVTNVYIGFLKNVAGDVVTVDYTTNLGNVGTVTLISGTSGLATPITSTTEWITKIVVKGSIAAGNSNSLVVGGKIRADLPHVVPADTPYQRDGVYTGVDSPSQRLYIENCAISSTLSLNGSIVAKFQEGDSQQAVAQRCGYLGVFATSAQIRPAKSISNGVQPIGGTMTMNVGASRRFGDGDLKPIIADLLPADLEYGDGQNPQQVFVGSVNPWTSPYLLPADLKVEVIDDYNGTGRQLVRFSWPEGSGIPTGGPGVGVRFKVRVADEAPVGTRNNTVHVFQEGYDNTAPNLNLCTGAGVDSTAVDVNNLSGNGNTGQLACTTIAPYTVIATGSVTADKEVKGSADADYVVAPGLGRVIPGDEASYRINVRNAGNVDLKSVVS